MKKLVIAAVAVAMAVAAEAASCSWETGKVSALAYDTFYIINASDYSTVLSALEVGGSTIADTLNDFDLDVVHIQAGSKGSTSGQFKVDDTAPTTTSFYALRLMTASGEVARDGIDYIFSSEFTVADVQAAGGYASGAGTPTAKFTLVSADSVTDPLKKVNLFDGGVSGTIGAIPEPTSGLLLLLGVSALALRRRRA